MSSSDHTRNSFGTDEPNVTSDVLTNPNNPLHGSRLPADTGNRSRDASGRETDTFVGCKHNGERGVRPQAPTFGFCVADSTLRIGV